jgi:pyruvate,water dikinase
MAEPRYVIPFTDLDLERLDEVGGKNASLGELIRDLTPLGVRVPGGFAVTAAAFRLHLAQHHIDRWVYEQLAQLDVRDVARLAEVGKTIRERICSVPLPQSVVAPIREAYRALSKEHGTPDTDVAVRSSATAEDLPNASFAGQQETYLNVSGEQALLDAVRKCMASLFTDRAIVYRTERGFAHHDVALSVGVQKMVRSDLAGAGVIFTLDTETGCRDVVMITAAWGLGETVVQGRVSPDEYWVHKPTLRQGFRPIIRHQCGAKAIKLIYATGQATPVREEPVAASDQQRFVLTRDEILKLARWALQIEEHYSKRAGHDVPMDLEWAKDGQTGELFIVQARPETVHSLQPNQMTFDLYEIEGEREKLVTGKSVGDKVGLGSVRVIRSAAELHHFRAGEVLVAPMTDPDWEPVLKSAAAVVTDHGGRTCHAAIVSRELGIPCVVGTGDGTSRLVTHQDVTVSCAEGDEGFVYRGRLNVKHDVIDPSQLPTPCVPVMLNVGNPSVAFRLGMLPSAGVGLARIEFIVSSLIGVHPMALVHPERTDLVTQQRIRELTACYDSPREFFIDRMATGVAQIAAAFFPRPVIVRMSDFKTNEYAGLLGGNAFEPQESNPMIGFRGASRYYNERYREGFALECAAMLRARQEMGLTNIKLMIPFCRTLGEGRQVIDELAKNGLRRGEQGLELYVMCEIPNNVILAEQFCELFDGFSIGSNDLTQLTLGIDRDSDLLAPLFDERDPGVKEMIRMVIEKAHKHGRKVGICGQAPSDHPEFGEFLVKCGIDTISVTHDALPELTRRLAVRQ